jgi:hypothetical protein
VEETGDDGTPIYASLHRNCSSVPVGLELWAGRVPVFETVAVALTPAEQKKVQVLAKDPGVLTEVDQEVQEDKRNR